MTKYSPTGAVVITAIMFANVIISKVLVVLSIIVAVSTIAAAVVKTEHYSLHKLCSSNI